MTRMLKMFGALTYIYVLFLIGLFLYLGFMFGFADLINFPEVIYGFVILAIISALQVFFTYKTRWLLKFPKYQDTYTLDEQSALLDVKIHENSILLKVLGIILALIHLLILILSLRSLYTFYIIFVTSMHRESGGPFSSSDSMEMFLALALAVVYLLFSAASFIYNVFLFNSKRKLIADA